MVTAYRTRLATAIQIADRDPDPLTEAELSRIWAAQSFPPEALRLVDGRPLRIILPGRPGGGSGPDYRDAVVAIDGVEYHGDLELHVRAGSFYDHGHHEDAAYDDLVLHVVYASDGATVTQLHSGGIVAVAEFAPWVGLRTQQLQDWLAAPPLWLEPCSDAVNRLGSAGVLDILRSAGERRLDVKLRRLRDLVAAEGEAQALWLTLLDNLGSGSERAHWRRLAEMLPATALASLVAAVSASEVQPAVQAALLATAGLFEPPEDLASYLPRPLSPPLAGGSRPASRPDRRLRGLAALWHRAAGDLPSYARQTVQDSRNLKQLTAAWSVPDPLGGPALIGDQRARELLLNAVLPFAAMDAKLSEKTLDFAARMAAAPAYGKTAFLEANLQRSDASLKVRTALQQQGLLAMVNDWCRTGGCGRCPLS